MNNKVIIHVSKEYVPSFSFCLLMQSPSVHVSLASSTPTGPRLPSGARGSAGLCGGSNSTRLWSGLTEALFTASSSSIAVINKDTFKLSMFLDSGRAHSRPEMSFPSSELLVGDLMSPFDQSGLGMKKA